MTALADQARALRAQGLSLRAIAAETGRGFGTIQKLLAGWAPSPVPAPVAEPRGCQWTDSSGRPWKFCDAPVSGPGSAWCTTHRRTVYVHRSFVGGAS